MPFDGPCPMVPMNPIFYHKQPKMKKGLILGGILLPYLVHAQHADSTRSPFVSTAPRLGGVTITNLVAPIKTDGNSFLMQLPTVDIGVPLYKNFSTAHTVLIKTGIRYEGLLLSNEKNIGNNSGFHSLTVPLLASYSFSRTTNLTLVGLATIASDFKQNIVAEDILYTAGARIGFQPRRSLRYGITFTYIHNYSGNFFLPLPDIDWMISQKWDLAGVLPARLSLKYKFVPSQSIGITTWSVSSMYRLNDGTEKQYLHLQQYSAGILYELNMGRWKLTLTGGHTMLERLETFNMDQKVSFNNFKKLYDRKPNISYRQNSFVAQGGISYQF